MKHSPPHRSRPCAAIFVFLIGFQGTGWFIAWQALQWQARLEVQGMLYQEDTPVREVRLQRDFYQKSKVGNKEIRLEGNLYDIQHITISEDSVALRLYHDKREQALYSILGIQFSQLEHARGAQPQPLAMWVAQWLGAAFILPPAFALVPMVETRELPVFCWRFPCATGVHAPPFAPPRPVFEMV